MEPANSLITRGGGQDLIPERFQSDVESDRSKEWFRAVSRHADTNWLKRKIVTQVANKAQVHRFESFLSVST